MQPAATSGAHWSAVNVPLQLMVLWYCQQSRVPGTPSITLVEGPSTQTGALATAQRLSAARPGHWLFQVSVAVLSVAGLV